MRGVTDPMERFLAETSALEAGEPRRRRWSLLDRILHRRGGKLPAYCWGSQSSRLDCSGHLPKDDDVVLLRLSPGRSTRRRPGESWADSMNRLTEGRDL